MLWWLPSVTLLGLAAPGAAQTTTVPVSIKPVNITQEDYLSVPATCLAVLTQNINCPPVLIHARDVGGALSRFYSDKSLTDLCTTACANSLSTWHRRVVGACANVRVPTSQGKLTLVAAWSQAFVETYATTCLVDGSGKLCNSVLRGEFGVNPANQQVTKTPASSAPCNGCFLSMLSTQLRLPLTATDPKLLNMYKTMTSKCSSTGWTIPPTPASTAWDSSTVPLSGQTCQQIATTNRISTMNLLSANGLAGNCYLFPSTGSVCIPSAAVCTPYTVKASDTCGSVARANDITSVQLIAWNTELGIGCVNLARSVGHVICVSQPGGAWENPDGAPEPTPEPTFVSIPAIDGMSGIGALPTPTRAGWNETLEVAPFAEGTRHDCTFYAEAPVLKDWIANTTSSSCVDVAAAFGVSVDELVSWNPSLEAGGGCSLDEGLQYCVQIHDVRAERTHEKCTEFAMASPGNDCAKFAAEQGLEKARFIEWNPVVGSDCGEFKTDSLVS
ncbi:hypothetical protein F5X68DRAFT_246636 [Plectosphaerella plurivora]|uniref:LysM domain-containing protein n=1 Tax=Plectosphaerella plurivora TaxID=936078 RepID=A0A9P8V5L9_9PEZI|nr:hypothetical protein F5X68DRAFT_246636 [Plectosphaerella plurivora]